MNDAPHDKTSQKSPFRSLVWLVVAVLLMVVGFVVLSLGAGDELSGGQKALKIVFGIVWFTYCVGMMIYNVLNYGARKRAKRETKAG
ncbi:MAG TPA: hypothetical protein P5119_04310 [Candidatus Aminicenantes bacterium]|nr:hypothetical protein [Candidatus Aminicenantes bacterium]HRY64548.1 hypothetical protein [Candidatus Aminicenantes bacterium]HRZ71461.1 hypothetical protein [Candidatus Aminicenantes bacterium]